MTTHTDNHARTKRQRLAALEREKAELERRLVDARRSLDRQAARAAEAGWTPSRSEAAPARRYARDGDRREGYGQAEFGPDDYGQDGFDEDEFSQDDFDPGDYDRDDLGAANYGTDDFGPDELAPQDGGAAGFAPSDAAMDGFDDGLAYTDDGAFTEAAPSIQDAAPVPLDSYAAATPRGHVYAPEARTAILVNHGRASAPRRLSRGHKIAVGAVASLALLITIVVMALPGPGPSWPASVARVEGYIAKACQNPDVRSEPGQVNFACAKSTRQILWVFSLLTSGNNPNFAEASSGRVGLEPITPSQGGAVATSLNLHRSEERRVGKECRSRWSPYD